MRPDHQETSSSLPSEDDGPLLPTHVELLAKSGIDSDFAAAHGVRSIETDADLPEQFQGWSTAPTPGLLFTWTSPTLGEVPQYRPDTPVTDDDGDVRKYVWPTGIGSVLSAVRTGGDTVLLVEGTKQALAAARYAPLRYAVYGLAGCWNWSRDNIPIQDLKVVRGKKVIIVLDADAGSNLKVYDAGIKLGAAAEAKGAADVRFMHLAATGTTGLDDLLGQEETVEDREVFLRTMLDIVERPTTETAINKAKVRLPAPSKPSAKASKTREARRMTVDDARTAIYVGDDKLTVIDEITDALLKRWNGSRLFYFGKVLAQLHKDEGVIEPLTKETFTDVLAETAVTFDVTRQGDQFSAWPDGYCIGAAMVSRAREYAQLVKLSRVPFVRADGTICQRNGYDEATHTYLLLDTGLENLVIPDEPTEDDVRAAVELLLHDWLVDVAFPDDASRANGLALVLTPFIRGLVALVPMAVLDGLQMGSGKGMFADLVSVLITGELSDPLPYNTDDDENRKVVTSAFRAGTELFLFDEAHVIEGSHLARTITAPTYKDRILGVSTMAEFPNRCTWVAMGNNVTVNGDMSRRVYRVALHPEGDRPQDRPESMFRHPQIKEWTKDNRADLLRACLTLIRAWFAAGSPTHNRGWQMGSFEAWDRMIGGILHHAGVPGFLENIQAWRGESDFVTAHWLAHLHWLRSVFLDKAFFASDAARELTRPNADVETPPGMEDTSPKNYARELGKAYASVNGRSFSGMRLVKAGTGAGGRVKWQVVGDSTSDLGKSGNPQVQDGGPGVGSQPTGEATDSAETGGLTCGESEQSEQSDASPLRTRDFSDAHTCVSTRENARMGEEATDPTDLTDSAQVSKGAAPQSVGSATDSASEHTGSPAETFAVRQAGPAAPQSVGPAEPVFGTVAFDLETGSAEMGVLFSSGPEYIRLGGLRADQGDVETTADLGEIVLAVTSAETVVGHNIMGFDMIALARHGGVDIRALAEQDRLVDTLLLARLSDPPLSRGNDGDKHGKRYDLDSLGARLLNHQKHGDLKALAKEFGGFDKIPVDDSRFVEYLRGDVLLTDDLMDNLVYDEYARREHRVAAIAAGITVNGFRVDVPLLHERYNAGEARRAELVARLVRDYDLPLTTKDGKRKAKNPAATEGGKAAIERALIDAGVDPEDIPRTDKTHEVSLGKEKAPAFLEEFAELHPGIVDVVEAVSSLNGIRTIYGTTLAHLVGDKVHPTVNMGQSTGRWSIQDPGLTVFGKRGGKAVERAILLPDAEDHVLISADLSQIDARAVAAWSQDPNYMALFEPGRDMHTEVAIAVFGDASFRETAKPLSHGSNYGLGLNGFLKRNPKVDPALAAKFYEMMPVQFPLVEEWKNQVRYAAEYGELLDNGFGRLLRVDPDRAYTAAPAAVGQATARDLLMEGLLRLPLDVAAMVRAVVHDEVVLSVPIADVDEVERVVLKALSFEWAPPGKSRPIQVEAGLGERGLDWAGCYGAKYGRVWTP